MQTPTHTCDRQTHRHTHMHTHTHTHTHAHAHTYRQTNTHTCRQTDKLHNAGLCEQFFDSYCNITHCMYKRVSGWKGVGWMVGMSVQLEVGYMHLPIGLFGVSMSPRGAIVI